MGLNWEAGFKSCLGGFLTLLLGVPLLIGLWFFVKWVWADLAGKLLQNPLGMLTGFLGWF